MYNNCECKCKFNHESLTVEAVATNLVITAKNTDSVCDKEEFNFRLCQCLPTTITTPLQVFMTINGANAAVLDRYGNYLYTNQLKTRKIYRGRYGENPAHVIFYNEGDEWGCGKCI